MSEEKRSASEDLTGQAFGNLEVLRLHRERSPRGRLWLTACRKLKTNGTRCTNQRVVATGELRKESKPVTSCRECAADEARRHRDRYNPLKVRAAKAGRG